MSFGSDWAVAPLDPLLGIYAAITRRTTDGKNLGGWVPQQKITVQEAIQCYTLNAAYATFEEGVKGSIEIGKYADLVVLSDDILNIPPETIDRVKVDYTIAGGRVVFSRQSSEAPETIRETLI